MDNKQPQGMLKMDNLCFPSIEFNRDTNILGPFDVNISFNIKHKKLTSKSVCVNILLTLTGNNSFLLKINEQANFELVNAEMLDESQQSFLLITNTVAIMLPYLRSQVSLITTQPGLAPIQLPIFNAIELTKNCTIE